MNRRSSNTETINQLNADIGCTIGIQLILVASVKVSLLVMKVIARFLQYFIEIMHSGSVTASRFYFLDSEILCHFFKTDQDIRMFEGHRWLMKPYS